MKQYYDNAEKGTVAGPVMLFYDHKRTMGYFYAVVPIIYTDRGVDSKGKITVYGLNGHGTSKSRKKVMGHLRFRSIRVKDNLTIEDRVGIDGKIKPKHRRSRSSRRLYDGKYW
ncbi:hypothetical protein HY500_01775 [Candidatus Woesearchaeota archaeon]|nr:hypothetical protein [Candidatus Woesearchaeota archaeon]